jgi:hypothetical protein
LFETTLTGVATTNVFEATQKISHLAMMAGHPEDIQPLLNILFGVEKQLKPMCNECIQEALNFTWERWYAKDDRYNDLNKVTPVEEYLEPFKTND